MAESDNITVLLKRWSGGENGVGERLLARLEGKPAPATMIDVGLVVRESCGSKPSSL